VTTNPLPNDASNEQSNPHALMEHYQNCIEMGDISFDVNQKLIMLELQEVYNGLLAPAAVEDKKSKFDQFISRSLSFAKNEYSDQKAPLVKGLYVWGGVGFGKTHMVDFFFKYLPIEEKMRLHFHRFMQIVHEGLKQHAHVENPLKAVAKTFASKTRLLCLDEMHVNDITDAMILAQLFTHLFDYGVTLVTTSNVPPSGLYKAGLQRSRFLPTIALFEEKTKVVNMDSGIDYRLRLLEQADVYQLIDSIHTKESTERKMQNYFISLITINRHKKRNHVLINGRKIPVIKWADGIAWFNFEALCNSNRSTDDYIQLGRFFHTIMISDIPIMSSMQNDAARRFVNMIDEFYDRHVNVIVTAEAIPTELYIGTRLAFEFERTASRLIEMQSKDYLSKKRGVH
jgi:cell division protein ZapE